VSTLQTVLHQERNLPTLVEVQEESKGGNMLNIRCAYSQEGKDRLRPKKPDREGVIISDVKGLYWNVLWDGLMTPQTYAKAYIMAAQPLECPVPRD
jgi:hypothetical protein